MLGGGKKSSKKRAAISSKASDGAEEWFEQEQAIFTFGGLSLKLVFCL